MGPKLVSKRHKFDSSDRTTHIYNKCTQQQVVSNTTIAALTRLFLLMPPFAKIARETSICNSQRATQYNIKVHSLILYARDGFVVWAPHLKSKMQNNEM